MRYLVTVGLLMVLVITEVIHGTSGQCSSTQFQCNSGECISSFFRCDGIRVCADGSDDTGCSSCRSGFRCSNGQCVSSFDRCDGRLDCTDGSDETGCTSCRSGAFQCSNGQCVSFLDRCDGNRDCSDGGDETGCPNSTNFGYIIAIGVGVPASFILCVCGMILCAVVYHFGVSRRAHTTATFPTQPVTTTTYIPTNSQEDGFQAHPAARTDVSQVPAHDMSIDPPQPDCPCNPTKHISPTVLSTSIF